MQMAIRRGLLLLALAPVAFAQDVDRLKRTADSALEAARMAKEARKEAVAAWEENSKDEALTKAKDDAEAAEEAALDALVDAADALSDAGGDVKEYRIYLNENGRPQADFGAALGLVEKWTKQAKDWLVANGPGIAVKTLVFLLILLLFKFLASFSGKVTQKAIETSRMKVSDLLKNFFINVVQKVVFIIGLFVALEYIGAPIGPLLAGVGVLGFVVGFALQDTLGNFASGIMILLYRPYDIGDFIDAGGTKGTVHAMTLVSTTLTTPDNQVVVVPNNKIWGSTITNVTARDTRRCDLTIGVGYGDDLDKAESVLMEVAKSHPLTLDNPEPVVKVGSLGDSSVNFLVRPWVKTADYWAVLWDLNKQIKQRLDAEGLNIPFPQRDVHVYQEGSSE